MLIVQDYSVYDKQNYGCLFSISMKLRYYKQGRPAITVEVETEVKVNVLVLFGSCNHKNSDKKSIKCPSTVNILRLIFLFGFYLNLIVVILVVIPIHFILVINLKQTFHNLDIAFNTQLFS
jgi:hypothetical protein